jgi:dolichol-phosphate mannosyltransferase
VLFRSYSIRLLYKLATDGIASFSVLPLRAAQFFAFLLSVLTLGGLISLVFWKPRDILTLVVAMGFVSCFSFAVLFFCLYVLGAYLSRVFIEIKGRPLYIVADARPPTSPVA